MLKKTIALLLLFTLLLCFMSCGEDNKESSAPAESKTESVGPESNAGTAEYGNSSETDTASESNASAEGSTDSSKNADKSETLSTEAPALLTSVEGKWSYEEDYMKLVRSLFAYDSSMADAAKQITDDEFMVTISLAFSEGNMTLAVELQKSEVEEFATDFYDKLYKELYPDGEISYEDFLAQQGGIENAAANLELDRYEGEMSIPYTQEGNVVAIGEKGDYMEIEFGTDSFTITAIYNSNGDEVPASDDNYFTGKTYFPAD